MPCAPPVIAWAPVIAYAFDRGGILPVALGVVFNADEHVSACPMGACSPVAFGGKAYEVHELARHRPLLCHLDHQPLQDVVPGSAIFRRTARHLCLGIPIISAAELCLTTGQKEPGPMARTIGHGARHSCRLP